MVAWPMRSRPITRRAMAKAPIATAPKASAPTAPAPSARAGVRAGGDDPGGEVSAVMALWIVSRHWLRSDLGELCGVEPVWQVPRGLDQVIRCARQELPGPWLRLHLAIAHRDTAALHCRHWPARDLHPLIRRI